MPKGLLVEQILNVACVIDEYELESEVISVDVRSFNGTPLIHVKSPQTMVRFENVESKVFGDGSDLEYPTQLVTQVDGIRIVALVPAVEEVA